VNAKTRNDSERACFYGFGTGECLLQGEPSRDNPDESVRLFAEPLRGFISPEQRLLNVADALVAAVQSGRHEGRAWEIESAAVQLRDELVRYFAGNLPAIPKDDLAF
jgi:hypothetical protein